MQKSNGNLVSLGELESGSLLQGNSGKAIEVFLDAVAGKVLSQRNILAGWRITAFKGECRAATMGEGNGGVTF